LCQASCGGIVPEKLFALCEPYRREAKSDSRKILRAHSRAKRDKKLRGAAAKAALGLKTCCPGKKHESVKAQKKNQRLL